MPAILTRIYLENPKKIAVFLYSYGIISNNFRPLIFLSLVPAILITALPQGALIFLKSLSFKKVS